MPTKSLHSVLNANKRKLFALSDDDVGEKTDDLSSYRQHDSHLPETIFSGRVTSSRSPLASACRTNIVELSRNMTRYGSAKLAATTTSSSLVSSSQTG